MICHIDFETRSECDLLKAGADAYSQHPSTDALCMSYAFGDEPVEIWIEGETLPCRLREHVEAGKKVRGHNIGGFEMLIWNNCMAIKHNWPELKIEQCEDTMAMAYAMSLPGSLDDASRAAGIAYEKDMKGHRIMLQLCKPRVERTPTSEPQWYTVDNAPEKFEALYAYCKQDVEVERALCKRLVSLSPKEQKLWELDYKINRRGVYVDIPAAVTALQVVEFEKLRLNKRMHEVTNSAVSVCSAAGQISDWLKLQGLEVPSIAKADVVEMLKRDLPAHAREALELRQEFAKTSTAKLNAMILGASAGNRVRGLFQYSGASTRRWSSRRIQLQNLPRPTISQKEIDHVFEIFRMGDVGIAAKADIIGQICQPMSAISSAIRGFLRAKPGHDFIACDFSSIEARKIAWLAGEEKILDVFRGDGKIYEVTAGEIYGVDPKEITKQDPRRQVGKVVVLAMGFGGGVGALQSMCIAYGVKLAPEVRTLWARASEQQKESARWLWQKGGEKYAKENDISKEEWMASEIIKQLWREKNPAIVQYWKDLENAAILAVSQPGKKFSAGSQPVTYLVNGSFLWCKLPSGGVLCYPYPEKFETMRPTLTYKGVDAYTKKWGSQHSYGGLLAENVTQASSRDLMADVMPNLEKRKYPIVMHIHDEVVVEVPKGFGSVEEVEQIMSVVPEWARGLPIAAEGWRDERFHK